MSGRPSTSRRAGDGDHAGSSDATTVEPLGVVVRADEAGSPITTIEDSQ